MANTEICVCKNPKETNQITCTKCHDEFLKDTKKEEYKKVIDGIKDYLLKITVKDKNYDIIKSIESILKEVDEINNG